MCQTLFYVPHELHGLPVFGFGWALLAWFLLAALLLWGSVHRDGWGRDALGHLPVLLLVGAVIVFVLPHLEVRLPDGTVRGLPIRGYGSMMLLGVVSGVIMSIYLGRCLGIDQDTVYSLSFWMCLGGVAGARTFYVVEYWSDFRAPSLRATLVEILRFTDGGLVVYGAVVGSLLAFVAFTTRYRLPTLRLADAIAPGMVLGLAFGRIGCLLNGCCYGGSAPAGEWRLSFPRYASVELGTLSPVYLHQLQSGQLHGIQITENGHGPAVKSVQPQSRAVKAGVKPGIPIRAINGTPVRNLRDVHSALQNSGPAIRLQSTAATEYRWSVDALPNHSLPVHPAQIYSSLNAALVCFLLWSFFPFRTRDGQVFALLMTAYPISRFLLEIVRVDEPGQLHTSLSISQLMSVVVLAAVAGLWVYLARQPPRVR